MERIYDRLIKKYDGSEVEFTFDDERPIQEQMGMIPKDYEYVKSHQFSVPKFTAAALVDNDWEITIEPNEEEKEKGKDITVLRYEKLKKNGCIAELSDCQLLTTLREVIAKKSGKAHSYNANRYIELKNKKAELSRNNICDKAEEKRIEEELIKLTYIEDYMEVEFENAGQYKSLFAYEDYHENHLLDDSIIDDLSNNRIKFNGKTYIRLTCGAAQARKQIVVFCNEEYADEVCKILDADRNTEAKMAASKFNAYFGLYSSSGRVVTMPRIAVIGSYNSKSLVRSMYETLEDGANFNEDSELIPQDTYEDFNRFDGGGIIRPEMALQWAYDLSLDYVPANFCIRYTFTKGAVACFDFVKWCAEKNDGNYIAIDIFGNEFDVREKDIIITEDMAKMINQWNSVEDYIKCSEKSGIDMRITKYAPKEDKITNTLNYQYIQTLNWGNGFPYNWGYLVKKYGYEEACKRTGKDDDKLYALAKETIDHYNSLLGSIDDNLPEPEKARLKRESYAKIQLMLCGNDSIDKVLNGKDWKTKSLLLFPQLLNDDNMKKYIISNIGHAIEDAKVGKGVEKGNYQCLVPDSYAFCEFMMGKEVKGLLPDCTEIIKVENGKEIMVTQFNCYSAFWNKEGVRNNYNQFALARSPQTYKSEWIKCNLINNEETDKWYMHQYSGIITPIYGDYTMKLAGSDFDYDIGFTTDNPIILDSIYDGLRVTMYDVPKPTKVILTKKALREADVKSFGQEIGGITNDSTTLYCIQARYNEEDIEYGIIESRIQQDCIAQSKQIDKTKIGELVKSIPEERFNILDVNDSKLTEEEREKRIAKNKVVMNKSKFAKPYFMRYRYDYLNSYYKLWNKKYDYYDENKREYKSKDWEDYYENNKKTKKVKEGLESLEIYMDPCPMNRWAWYIESLIEPNKKENIGISNDFDCYCLMSEDEYIDGKAYEKIKAVILDRNDVINESPLLNKIKVEDDDGNMVNNISREHYVELLFKELIMKTNTNAKIVTNCLVKLFYIEKACSSMSLLWELAGEYIYYNLLNRMEYTVLPIPEEDGTLKYLFNNYTLKLHSRKDIIERMYYI